MIESISIADVATYDETGVRIEGLKKVGFIYGANGTGKTTITRLLADGTSSDFSNCEVSWKGANSLPTLVYNRDFREKNFGEIDGVFTLGQATKEEMQAIDQMVSKLSEIKAEGIKKKRTLDTLDEQRRQREDTFREAAWSDVYKKHEVTFKDAFSGVKTKEKFKNRLTSEARTNATELKEFDDLQAKAATVFGQAPVKLPYVTQIQFGGLTEIESNAIWTKKIVGKDDIEISKLIQHLGINDWVSQGRSYIQGDGICPFCQKETLTKDVQTQLNSYFDAAFEKNTKLVKDLSSEYALSSEALINLLNEIEANEKEKPDSKISIELLIAKIKTITTQLHANGQLVESKVKEPSRSFALSPLLEQLDGLSSLIADANNEITKHNQIVVDYQAEKLALTKAVWRFLVEDYRAAITTYEQEIKDKEKGIAGVREKKDELSGEYRQLDRRIKEANKNVTSVQPSVDEINKTLESYGFQNFKIVPSPEDSNKYQIQRECGAVADSTLSEGEVTFITFLYFLQRAKGGLSADSASDERVLVIDDPISSLDSNVLFIVSTLIQDILSDVRKDIGVIRQVLLLTHNVYFHKEVSYVNGKATASNDTYFWILRKKNKVSTIQPCLTKNPIHNSYELLWRELQNMEQNDGITIQNTMRRIIENYFKILGKYDYNDLFSAFKDSPEEQKICRSLVSWINDGSHTIPDDLFIQAHDDEKEKYRDVFEKIFIHMKHHEHYKMMMGSSSGTSSQMEEGTV